MARLLADENLPRPVVARLCELGHDVMMLDEANRDMTDPDILGVAVAHARAVLTLDRRDSVRLHRRSADHPGIVVCAFEPDFAALATRIDAVLADSEELAGRLIRVLRPGPGSG